MRNLGQHFTGAILGAVSAVGIVWGLQWLEMIPTAVTYPPDETMTTGRARDTEDRQREVPQLARIEARLSDLASGIKALDEKIDALSNAAPARTPIVPRGSGTVVIDEEAIARAFERVEERRKEKKLEGLSLDELIMESKRLVKEKDFVGARRALEAVLAQARKPKERAFALTQLGMLHRNNGDSISSVRVLRDAIAEFGMDSQYGAGAAYQLVWTQCKDRDYRAARQMAQTIANSANVTESLQGQARWAGAIVAEVSGDKIGARAEFQSILRDYGNKPELRGMVLDARRRLERMK